MCPEGRRRACAAFRVAPHIPERKFWRKRGGNDDIESMKTPTQPNKPEHRELIREHGPLSTDMPPNLAKRIQEVEVEMKNGLLLTHEDVLQRIRLWPTR
jgi:hypothetical protein